MVECACIEPVALVSSDYTLECNTRVRLTARGSDSTLLTQCMVQCSLHSPIVLTMRCDMMLHAG